MVETGFNDQSNKNKVIYSWKTDDIYTVISGLKQNAYYSHYSAMFFHQLTLQIPKTYYLNHEHSSEMAHDAEKQLSQEDIDKALSGSQRKSGLFYTYKDFKVCIINGKKTNKLGVIRQSNKEQSFEYTDLERTLIDIAIRPAYSGGIFEVLEAYRKAKEKVDIKRLAGYLKQLDYRYPYHQAVGFYLKRAGYPEKQWKLFEKNIELKFYLTYEIRNKEFSERWQLYYPKGF